RGRRTARRPAPVLTATQAREATGVILAGLGLLAAVAMLVGCGPVLLGLHGGLAYRFGLGWPLPVAACIALGGFWLWPHPPALRASTLAAGLVSLVSILGLMSLTSAPWGGSLGRSVEQSVASLAGASAALVLLSLAFVLGLIVAFRFSPGAAVTGVLLALRAAFDERERIEALVRRATREEASARKDDVTVPAAHLQALPAAPPPPDAHPT